MDHDFALIAMHLLRNEECEERKKNMSIRFRMTNDVSAIAPPYAERPTTLSTTTPRCRSPSSPGGV